MSLPPMSSDATYSSDSNSICDSNISSKPSYTLSPDTRQFVQESLEKGLPIIPFPLPTFVIAEHHMASKKQAADQRRNSLLDANDAGMIPTSPDKNSDKTFINEDDVKKKKSLEKLVKEAKHELEQESLKRKVQRP